MPLQCAAVLTAPSVCKALICVVAAANDASLKLVPLIDLTHHKEKNEISASVSWLFHFVLVFLVGEPCSFDFGGIVK